MEDQVTKGLADYLRCGICYQLLTSDKKPVECEQCRNQLSCTDCISDWLVQNPTCPFCKQQYPMFAEISPTMVGLLASLKLHCKFKKRGC
jgi:Ring finger domain